MTQGEYPPMAILPSNLNTKLSSMHLKSFSSLHDLLASGNNAILFDLSGRKVGSIINKQFSISNNWWPTSGIADLQNTKQGQPFNVRESDNQVTAFVAGERWVEKQGVFCVKSHSESSVINECITKVVTPPQSWHISVRIPSPKHPTKNRSSCR